ncbi:MAG: hydroxymethylbilane synthase [Bradymonadia bacterium]
MSADPVIRIGTRGSDLALWQADYVADRLKAAHPGLQVERTIFKTRGDRFLGQPLSELGGKGLFTHELEEAMIAGEIDIAVHSLKDMPTKLPEGLTLGAIPVRGDVRDVLITRIGESPEAPPLVGTSSLRRACMARRRWPESEIVPIRGNVNTRVNRLIDPPPRRVDTVILAMAGMLRLEFTEREDVEFMPLNPEHWIPAVAQGALAVEARAGDAQILGMLSAIHHADTATCVTAERTFLAAVEGDCRIPVGAYATVDRGNIRLKAFVGAPDGSEMVVHTDMGTDPEALGATVAQALLDAGGRGILQALKATDH